MVLPALRGWPPGRYLLREHRVACGCGACREAQVGRVVCVWGGGVNRSRKETVALQGKTAAAFASFCTSPLLGGHCWAGLGHGLGSVAAGVCVCVGGGGRAERMVVGKRAWRASGGGWWTW